MPAALRQPHDIGPVRAERVAREAAPIEEEHQPLESPRRLDPAREADLGSIHGHCGGVRPDRWRVWYLARDPRRRRDDSTITVDIY